MKFLVSKKLIPFISKPLEENHISYAINSDKNNEVGIVMADISERTMKKIKRIAWASMLSSEINLPVLSRQDIGNCRPGVIPKSELHCFKEAFL